MRYLAKEYNMSGYQWTPVLSVLGVESLADTDDTKCTVLIMSTRLWYHLTGAKAVWAMVWLSMTA